MRDLFNSDFPEIHIDKPIRLIELFGGYGSQSMALERIGADFEPYFLCEFDEPALRNGRRTNSDFHGAMQDAVQIRKLTPRECGRLMGVKDSDIDKMAAVNSNSQLYKQFGNSIVVDVMCAMFRKLNIRGVERYV